MVKEGGGGEWQNMFNMWIRTAFPKLDPEVGRKGWCQSKSEEAGSKSTFKTVQWTVPDRKLAKTLVKILADIIWSGSTSNLC